MHLSNSFWDVEFLMSRLGVQKCWRRICPVVGLDWNWCAAVCYFVLVAFSVVVALWCRHRCYSNYYHPNSLLTHTPAPNCTDYSSNSPSAQLSAYSWLHLNWRSVFALAAAGLKSFWGWRISVLGLIFAFGWVFSLQANRPLQTISLAKLAAGFSSILL